MPARVVARALVLGIRDLARHVGAPRLFPAPAPALDGQRRAVVVQADAARHRLLARLLVPAPLPVLDLACFAAVERLLAAPALLPSWWLSTVPASCFPHAEHALGVPPCSALAASVPPAVPLAGVAAVLGVVLSVLSAPWLTARCAAPALAADDDLAATLLLSTSSPVAAAAAVQEIVPTAWAIIMTLNMNCFAAEQIF